MTFTEIIEKLPDIDCDCERSPYYVKHSGRCAMCGKLCLIKRILITRTYENGTIKTWEACLVDNDHTAVLGWRTGDHRG